MRQIQSESPALVTMPGSHPVSAPGDGQHNENTENNVVLWENKDGRLVKWIDGDGHTHTIVWSARRSHYPHAQGYRAEMVLATFTGHDGCSDGERAHLQAVIRRLQGGRVCYLCLRTLEWDNRAGFYFCPARP